MNLSYFPYNFDQLHTLLSEINISSDVIGITKTWLKKQTLRTKNIKINGYNLENTPTEASCGGTLLYIKNKLNYICQKYLNIYKKNELQSTFTEILTNTYFFRQKYHCWMHIQTSVHASIRIQRYVLKESPWISFTW